MSRQPENRWPKGLKLKNHYVHSSCTPSRAALLTGRYASNTGLPCAMFPGSVAGQNSLRLGWSFFLSFFQQSIDQLCNLVITVPHVEGLGMKILHYEIRIPKKSIIQTQCQKIFTIFFSGTHVTVWADLPVQKKGANYTTAQWCVFNNFSLDKHRQQIWDEFLFQF